MYFIITVSNVWWRYLLHCPKTKFIMTDIPSVKWINARYHHCSHKTTSWDCTVPVPFSNDAHILSTLLGDNNAIQAHRKIDSKFLQYYNIYNESVLT
jgi:hypothetical protein